jgi:hypothetical protein
MSLSKTVVIQEEPTAAEEHPHSLPDEGGRPAIPEEIALLHLLAAARLAALKMLKAHDGNAVFSCECWNCKHANYIIVSIDMVASSIEGELIFSVNFRETEHARAKELLAISEKEEEPAHENG